MNIRTRILIVFLALTGMLIAQPRIVREANKKFRNENYCEAADECIAAYKKLARKGNFAIRVKGSMAFKAAECYRLTERIKEAHEWYDKAILLRYQEIEPKVFYYNAEVLRNAGDYKRAIDNYLAYKAIVPNDGLADVGIKSCKDHDSFKENRTKHVVTNITQLNKEGFEMSPMFVDKKGSKVAFSTSREGVVGSRIDPRSCQPYMDIFVSEFDKKGNWTAPKPIQGDGINTEDNEGTVCIDARGKTMFFTRCPSEAKLNLGCEIWMCEARGQGWGRPIELEELKTNDTVSIGHPCVDDEGKFLIFASDFTGPGWRGGRDLWYSTYNKKAEKWSEPINMGPEINTAGNELFPTFANNGDLLYSSDGLPGMGAMDIFRAAKLKDQFKWENPTNLGSPINSDFNDYGLIEVTDRKGYFSSERKGVKGDNTNPDLFQYELPEILCDIRVVVTDKLERSKLEGVNVVVTGINDNKISFEGVTDASGSIFWKEKPTGGRYCEVGQTYKIAISKPGYFEDTVGAIISTIDLTDNQSFLQEMSLFPDRPIRLPEIRYPTGGWTFVVDETINSVDSLLFVYNILVENPNVVLELSSHTDYRSSDNLNQVLSENRAKACYKFLVEEKGIDPRRIIPVGRGERSPAKVKDEAGNEVLLTQAYIDQFKKSDPVKWNRLLALNRRTEGKVLSKDFNPDTAPPANPNYSIFKVLPKK